MSSQTDPDRAKKPQGKAAPAGKAAPRPAARAGTAAPASATRSGKPPAPAPQRAAAASRSAPEDDAEGEPAPTIAAGFLKETPAWAVSLLVHVVVLLAMALIVSTPPAKDKPRSITSSAAESEEEFSEELEEMPEDVPVESPDTAEVVIATDVVVEPVEVVSNADDVDAAPLAVELSEFGTETAPSTDLMATIGAAGGTGSGLGGRAQAGQLAARGGGGRDTEEAVDRALKWLAIHQLPDGSWSFDLKDCPSCQGKCSHSGNYPDRSGATAMALLPFLGRGYTHKEGPYKKEVERGISYLAALSAGNGGKVYGPGGHSMYVQGLAGIALSECYAMSQDNRLQAPTQAALNFIMNAQDPQGGGWRYHPKQPGDTSAVGWQIMALKSGNMAYLPINPLTIKKAVEFLDSVQEDDGANYGYTGPGGGAATSAVGLLCRMYLGWKKDNPALERGVERLAKMGPNADLYFDYYATQIMHHMEGDMWVAWNTKMKGMLLKAQSTKDHEAGSWYDGVSGGHAGHGGRLYCTSLATMILEVYYRHLPIYRNNVVTEEFTE